MPSDTAFLTWIKAALAQHKKHQQDELTLRVVGLEEMQVLNHTYRDKDQATNVLSFPFEMPEGISEELDDCPAILGDIVVCAAVVNEEAKTQDKAASDHWAHMTIHGVLHLLGYDHEESADAEQMEGYEVEILSGLDINNPYMLANSTEN